LFEREAPAAGARVLEVGCGPALMWKVNAARIDPSWTLTLTDFSPGMVDVARGVLGERAQYAVCNAEQLPFADESFDVVIANHMLYHVQDRPKAFAEFARALADGGTVHASTNGYGHLKELHELLPDWEFAFHMEDFGLETGAEQLAAFFTDVRVERFENRLDVTEVEPVLAYIRSSPTYRGQPLDEARATIEAALARDGVFRIRNTPGVITCRKP
jgi:ubiquinone/menaquinone biosynthesis C-methylase UbiE